jgi:hypothetical protein
MKTLRICAFLAAMLSFSSGFGQIVGSNFLVSLRLIQGNDSTETIVYFDLNANDTVDLNSDALLLSGSGPNLYSTIGSSLLAINAMGPLHGEKMISLGYSLANAQPCKIRLGDASAWFGNAVLELKDLQTNNTINLLQQSTYQFSSAAGTFNQRFRLRIKPPANAYGILSGCTGQNSKIVIENFSGTAVTYVLTDGNFNPIDSGSVNNDTIQTPPLPLGYYNVDFLVGTLSYSIQIHISLPTAGVQVAAITPDTLWDVDGGAPVFFTGFFTNLAGSDSVFWNFGDGSPIQGLPWYINTAFHSYTSPGTYCTTVSGSNGQCSDTDTICIVAYTITGIETQKQNQSLMINEGKVWFNQLEVPAQMMLTDIRGCLVSRPVSLAPSTGSADLPSNLESGIYFVRLLIPGSPCITAKWFKN